MNEAKAKVLCVCGEALDEQPNLPDAERTPCPKCGSLGRSLGIAFSDRTEAHDYARLKVKNPEKRRGKKRPNRPILELGVGDERSQDTGKWSHKVDLFDREKRRRLETVVDKESNQVLHHCDHALPDHKGHGSDKPKKK